MIMAVLHLGLRPITDFTCRGSYYGLQALASLRHGLRQKIRFILILHLIDQRGLRLPWVLSIW
jgi:hypothetical protein